MTDHEAVVRLAMWSGPRNISTAMMRSFENRTDTVVVDEPLYGPYLAMTGLDHPMRDAVLDAQGSDWRVAVEQLFEPVGGAVRVQYQKQMTHHLLPTMDTAWTDRLVNCFLIRDPALVLASYRKRRSQVTAADLGFDQQGEIFDRVAQTTGVTPPVLDAADVLADPPGMLATLCAAVGIEFDPSMLAWPAGARESDGVWAPHWYDAVRASTGFQSPADAPVEPMERAEPADDHAAILESATPIYERLRAHRLVTSG